MSDSASRLRSRTTSTVARFFLPRRSSRYRPCSSWDGRDDGVGIGHLGVVHVGAALADGPAGRGLALRQPRGHQQFDDSQARRRRQ